MTRASALAAGYSPDQIDRAVRSGRWTALRRGVYLVPLSDPEDPVRPQRAVVEPHHHVRAALQRIKEPVWVSHVSLATLWELPTIDTYVDVTVTGQPPHAAGPTVCTRSYPGIRVYPATVPPHHAEERFGVPALTVPRTVVDLGRQWPLEHALVVADAAARRRLVSKVDLESVISDCRRWPFLRRAKRLVDLVDPVRESPLESISAAMLHLQGIEPPECQRTLLDQNRRFLARVDFYWPRWHVVGEADGALKYRDTPDISDSHPEGRWQHERERQRRIELTDRRVVRWTWPEIRFEPWIVARRIRETMVLAARDGIADVPAADVRALRRSLMLPAA